MKKSKKVTAKMIIQKEPCEGWTEERIRKYIGDGMTVLEILDLRKIKNVSISGRLWCVVQFLSNIANRKFAIWCERQYETNIPEIKEYIDIVEKYYVFKTITKREMQAMSSTAYGVAYSAAYSTAKSAAYWAACRAAGRAANRAACWKKQAKKLKELIREGE